MINKQDIKRHLISAGITFIATFVMMICAFISADNFVFSKTTILAGIVGAIFTASRASVKIIYEVCVMLTSKEE